MRRFHSVCCHLTFHSWPVGQLSCFLPGLRGSQRESERAITLFSNTSKWRKTGVKLWDGVMGQQGSETTVSGCRTDTSQEDQLLSSLSSVCKPETRSSKLTSRVWVALKRWSVRRCYDRYTYLQTGSWQMAQDAFLIHVAVSSQVVWSFTYFIGSFTHFWWGYQQLITHTDNDITAGMRDI